MSVPNFGPLQSLMDDETIYAIHVNGPRRVYVEQKGYLRPRPEVTFENDDHVQRFLIDLLSDLDVRLGPERPVVNTFLPDGSHISAVIRPASPAGPVLSIVKVISRPLSVEDLIRFGAVTPELADFLRSSVTAYFTICVAGGTGSGKLTLFNILSHFIPDEERVVAVETTDPLDPRLEHLIRLRVQPSNLKGEGGIDLNMLLETAARFRPDRLIVGEILGREAFDLFQTLNRGFGGTLFSLYAWSAADAVNRLELMHLMTRSDLPIGVIQRQIMEVVDLFVIQNRLRDGTRRVTQIAEARGVRDDGSPDLVDLFVFEETGMENGKIIGRIRATGEVPNLERYESAGIDLPMALFGKRQSRRRRKTDASKPQ